MEKSVPKPKILFCSIREFKREWGAPKIMIEVAEVLCQLGWECVFAGPKEMGVSGDPFNSSEGLRQYLIKHASDYDVIEYEHDQLPFNRGDFDPKPLMVARVSLLSLHFLKIQLPQYSTIKENLKKLINLFFRKKTNFFSRIGSKALFTLQQADYINVANDWDQKTIIESGIDPSKIGIIPYGLTKAGFVIFNKISNRSVYPKRIVFIGTFDRRKGGPDLPKIFKGITAQIPDMEYRLLGTDGEFQGTEQILNLFQKNIRNKIEIIPKYNPLLLPELLKDCSLGVFPSYVESFGFSVLEMLASGINVVAYFSPGPHALLRKEDLIEPGNISAIVQRVVYYFNDPNQLKNSSVWAKQKADEYSWSKFGKLTDSNYRLAMSLKNKNITFNRTN